MLLIAIIATIVLFIDQWTKYLAIDSLTFGESVPLFSNYIKLSLVYNRGVAFGMFNNNAFLALAAVCIGFILLIYVLYKIRIQSIWYKIACGLMIGGAVGNIIDRVRIGAVIDFFDLTVWPVFNVADSCITIAAFFFIIAIIKNKDTNINE